MSEYTAKSERTEHTGSRRPSAFQVAPFDAGPSPSRPSVARPSVGRPSTTPPPHRSSAAARTVITSAALARGDMFYLPGDVGVLHIGAGWRQRPKARQVVDVDLSAVLFDTAGRRLEHVTFDRPCPRGGSMRHLGDDLHNAAGPRRSAEGEPELRPAALAVDTEAIMLRLGSVPDEVATIAVLLNVYTPGKSLADVQGVYVRLVDTDPSSPYAFRTPADTPQSPASTPRHGPRRSVASPSSSAAPGPLRASDFVSTLRAGTPDSVSSAADAKGGGPTGEVLRHTMLDAPASATGSVALLLDRVAALDHGLGAQRLMAGATLAELFDSDEDPAPVAASAAPGWRVLAAASPVVGTSHRQVQGECAALLEQMADGWLPVKRGYRTHGFRAGPYREARRLVEEEHHRRAADARFLDDFLRTRPRRRYGDDDSGPETDEIVSEPDEAATPQPTPLRPPQKQTAGARSPSLSPLRARVVRSGRGAYSVGRGVRARPCGASSSSSDGEGGGAYDELLPQYASPYVVRYDPQCYNVGSRRAELHEHYVKHRARYTAAARSCAARAEEAQSAAALPVDGDDAPDLGPTPPPAFRDVHPAPPPKVPAAPPSPAPSSSGARDRASVSSAVAPSPARPSLRPPGAGAGGGGSRRQSVRHALPDLARAAGPATGRASLFTVPTPRPSLRPAAPRRPSSAAAARRPSQAPAPAQASGPRAARVSYASSAPRRAPPRGSLAARPGTAPPKRRPPEEVDWG